MIVIVDCGIGNAGSIVNMLKKIGYKSIVSSQESDVSKADKLILPGVGAFDQAISKLSAGALITTLHRKVLEQKTPILGICLGMQLMTEKSEEGRLPGFGWIKGETIRFKTGDSNKSFKVPHMGWNTLTPGNKSIFSGMEEETRFYFVHSYHVVCNNAADVAGTTFYGYEFASAVQKENIAGVQFHPEKSHKFGMHLLKNFIEKV